MAEHDAAAAAGPGPAQVDPSMQVAGEAFFVTNGVDMPFFTFCREVWRAAGDTTRPEDVKVVPFWLAVAFAWVVEKIAKLRGVSPTVTVDSLRFTNMTRYYNTEKARKRLGWEPAVAWDEGVRRGVQVESYPVLLRLTAQMT